MNPAIKDAFALAQRLQDDPLLAREVRSYMPLDVRLDTDQVSVDALEEDVKNLQAELDDLHASRDTLLYGADQVSNLAEKLLTDVERHEADHGGLPEFVTEAVSEIAVLSLS